ncbi:hypothetical protein HHI36_006340 [Cryptolaemus montrouzieri]|uniref:Uncharacterized protein n=1 Tax=Cryptolaemus montrouzieri TaxID=559131 RepID=A0ABD2NWY5_9CUCU
MNMKKTITMTYTTEQRGLPFLMFGRKSPYLNGALPDIMRDEKTKDETSQYSNGDHGWAEEREATTNKMGRRLERLRNIRDWTGIRRKIGMPMQKWLLTSGRPDTAHERERRRRPEEEW